MELSFRQIREMELGIIEGEFTRDIVISDSIEPFFKESKMTKQQAKEFINKFIISSRDFDTLKHQGKLTEGLYYNKLFIRNEFVENFNKLVDALKYFDTLEEARSYKPKKVKIYCEPTENDIEARVEVSVDGENWYGYPDCPGPEYCYLGKLPERFDNRYIVTDPDYNNGVKLWAYARIFTGEYTEVE